MFHQLLFATRVAHDQLIHSNQHSQYPKKHKKKPETRKQLRLEDDRRFKDQKTEKSSWWLKKFDEKGKVFEKRNWLMHNVKGK